MGHHGARRDRFTHKTHPLNPKAQSVPVDEKHHAQGHHGVTPQGALCTAPGQGLELTTHAGFQAQTLSVMVFNSGHGFGFWA